MMENPIGSFVGAVAKGAGKVGDAATHGADVVAENTRRILVKCKSLQNRCKI